MCFVRSEVKSQVDSVSVRVDRMEREMEYLENKIPNQSDIEMEEALLEQQIKAAELDQLKKKAKLKVENGRSECDGSHVYWWLHHSESSLQTAAQP